MEPEKKEPDFDRKQAAEKLGDAVNKLMMTHAHIRQNGGSLHMTEDAVKILFDVLGRLSAGDAAWEAKPGGAGYMFEIFLAESNKEWQYSPEMETRSSAERTHKITRT